MNSSNLAAVWRPLRHPTHNACQMLVPLTADEGSSTPWAMIEMQGEVERKDGGSLDDAFDVGTLAVTSSVRGRRADRLRWAGGQAAEGTSCSRHQQTGPPRVDIPAIPTLAAASLLQGAVLLTIGYHQLEGKRIELKKPFAVLDKVGGGEEQGAAEYKASWLGR